MGWATALPYIIEGASVAASAVNTHNTAVKQNKALAQSILDQTAYQKKANTDVNTTLNKVSASTAEKPQQQRLNDYVAQLRAARQNTDTGLATPGASQAFKADAAKTAQGLQSYGNEQAGLMSQMDAPAIQRQQEGFDYNALGGDLGVLSREAQLKNFVDMLRVRGIRRNPFLDLASGFGMAYAGNSIGKTGSSGMPGTLLPATNNDTGYVA